MKKLAITKISFFQVVFSIEVVEPFWSKKIGQKAVEIIIYVYLYV